MFDQLDFYWWATHIHQDQTVITHLICYPPLLVQCPGASVNGDPRIAAHKSRRMCCHIWAQEHIDGYHYCLPLQILNCIPLPCLVGKTKPPSLCSSPQMTVNQGKPHSYHSLPMSATWHTTLGNATPVCRHLHCTHTDGMQ